VSAVSPIAAAVAKVLAKVLAKVAWQLVRKWAHKTARVRGEWLGRWKSVTPADAVAAAQAGYKADTPTRLIVNDSRDPRRWRHESGTEYMPDTPGITDGGSTPVLARDAVKKWADLEPFGKFADAFYFHDAAYRDAGCWVRLPKAEAAKHGLSVPKGSDLSAWAWMPLTRAMADTLLFQQMPSLGGRNGEVQAIFRAVRVGAARPWRNHRRRAATRSKI
jgi:hypothetical protein